MTIGEIFVIIKGGKEVHPVREQLSPELRKRLVTVLAAILLLVIVLTITVISSIIEKYTPTDERADAEAYFDIQTEDEIGLLFQNEKMDTKGLLVDGTVYIDYETVKEYLNERFYWDSNENVLVYTTPTDVITAEVGSEEYTVSKTKNTENYVIVKVDGDVAYIALDFILKYTNISYETLSEPNRMHITYQWGTVTRANVTKDNFVRVKGGIKSPILTDVLKGDVVEVIEQEEKWTKVRTEDAYIGYIQNKYLGDVYEEENQRDFDEPVYTSIQKDYKINMVWHQATTQEANDQLLTLLEDTKGVNTISPTWFSLRDNKGNITSLADSSYVDHAHELGLEVWALVDNFNDDVSTYDVLSYTSKREKLINQLISEAIEYDLDGINIDFEELSTEEGPPFIEFIRELSVKCRANGIVLSIDNYVPSDYTDLYDREEQGTVADYVIIMGYDEHYAGSESPGSVASLSFVKEGIVNTLEEVPKEKVINAIPFYTRLWVETPKTEEEIAEEDLNSEYVPYNLTSQAIGMENIQKLLNVNGIEPVWDDSTSQYYANYTIDGITYEVWLDEETSIEEKMKLISEYDLAGVAAWKLGLEKDSIWDVIIKYVN